MFFSIPNKKFNTITNMLRATRASVAQVHLVPTRHQLSSSQHVGYYVEFFLNKKIYVTRRFLNSQHSLKVSFLLSLYIVRFGDLICLITYIFLIQNKVSLIITQLCCYVPYTENTRERLLNFSISYMLIVSHLVYSIFADDEAQSKYETPSF